MITGESAKEFEKIVLFKMSNIYIKKYEIIIRKYSCLAFCPTPRVQAGTKLSPCTSANVVSPPKASISNSPFNEKPIDKRNIKIYHLMLN